MEENINAGTNINTGTSSPYPLRSLFWETTLRCNAFCQFCGSRCGEQQSLRELTTEEICDTLRQIAGRYNANEIMLNVTGGEPLLRKDLFEVTAYARSLGFHWGLVSNGILLTEDVIRRMEETGCETMSVSLDGLAALHNQIRGVSRGFERTVDGIRQLGRKPWMQCLMVTTVVSKKNLHELPALRDFLKTLPFHVWRVCPVDPIGRADADEAQLLDADELKQMLDFLRESRCMGLPYQVTTSCSHYFGTRDLDVHGWPFFCATGKQIASILANGDIYVCPNVPRVPSLIQGNVRTDRFTDVWERGFQFFRDDHGRFSDQCRDCSAWEDCRGDSTHTWDFELRRPKVCAARLGLLPQSEIGGRRHPGHSAGFSLTFDGDARASLSLGRDIRRTDRGGSFPVRSFDELIADYRKKYGKLRGLFAAGESECPNQVVFSPEATEYIFHQMTSDTEQIACLLGTVYHSGGSSRSISEWTDAAGSGQEMPFSGLCPSPGGIPRFAWDISQSPIVGRSMSTISDYGCGHPRPSGGIFLAGRLYHVILVRELQPTYASPDALLADENILRQAREQLAALNVMPEDPIRIVGFLHTHPGDLEISMSSGDYEWHCGLLRSGMDPVNVIFNPQKRRIAAYTGARANLTELHMLKGGNENGEKIVYGQSEDRFGKKL
ncbi:MAG: radical SAM protein [Clostridiales bacterium]|nr:radical SAM protein [Clostridiales bacterium]